MSVALMPLPPALATFASLSALARAPRGTRLGAALLLALGLGSATTAASFTLLHGGGPAPPRGVVPNVEACPSSSMSANRRMLARAARAVAVRLRAAVALS